MVLEIPLLIVARLDTSLPKPFGPIEPGLAAFIGNRAKGGIILRFGPQVQKCLELRLLRLGPIEEMLRQLSQYLAFDRHEPAIVHERLGSQATNLLLKFGGGEHCLGGGTNSQLRNLLDIEVELIPEQAARRRIGTR